MTMGNIQYLTVHCSATPCTAQYDTEWIRKLHLNRGWSDIGYHYVIEPNGTVEDGRSLNRMGAHIKGHNENNIGVCLVGGVDEHNNTADNFTPKQKEELACLIEKLMKIYKIRIENVKGHRDWYGDDESDWLKECPCFDVEDFLKERGIAATQPESNKNGSLAFGEALKAMKEGRAITRRKWGLYDLTLKNIDNPLRKGYGKVFVKTCLDANWSGIWEPNTIDILAEDWKIL